jgi:hypothetical protein
MSIMFESEFLLFQVPWNFISLTLEMKAVAAMNQNPIVGLPGDGNGTYPNGREFVQ